MDSSNSDAAHPPEWMQANETSLADGARKYVNDVETAQKKKTWLRWWSRKKGNDGNGGERDGKKGDKGKRGGILRHESTGLASIHFGDRRNERESQNLEQTDLFKWAVMYENQRGVTIFSTAYYSTKSLFAFDPPPFTALELEQSSSRIHLPPNVSLSTYPLPDPTWRWVSQSWLVDMRRAGDVGHDGYTTALRFQYSWDFKCKKWRAKAGWFSAGGFVRRRIWVRLMMHPSATRLRAEAAMNESEDGSDKNHRVTEIGRVWRGDGGDWERVRKTLKQLGRDGPRLDLWAGWLSEWRANERPLSPQHAQQWTDDDFTRDRFEIPPAEVVGRDGPWLERPSREWISTLLQQYGRELGGCFVYPNSRQQLRELFLDAGFVQETHALGSSDF